MSDHSANRISDLLAESDAAETVSAPGVIPLPADHPAVVAAVARHGEMSRALDATQRDRLALEATLGVGPNVTTTALKARALLRGDADGLNAQLAKLAELRESEPVLAEAVRLAAVELANATEAARRELTAYVREHVLPPAYRKFAREYLRLVAAGEEVRRLVETVHSAGLRSGVNHLPGQLNVDARNGGDGLRETLRSMIAAGMIDLAAVESPPLTAIFRGYRREAIPTRPLV